jgi:hypothetical protein
LKEIANDMEFYRSAWKPWKACIWPGHCLICLGMVLKDSAWKAWVPVFDRGLELMLEIIFFKSDFF